VSLPKSDKIKFLVKHKFPFSLAPPPVPTLDNRRQNSRFKLESHKELLKSVKDDEAELWAKPNDELLALYEKEWAEYLIERKAEGELEEQQRSYNKPYANADLEHWGKAPYWTLEEAITLNFGKDPARVNWEDIRPYTNVSSSAKKYAQLRDLVIRAAKAKQLDSPVLPGDFLKWTERMGFDAPKELVEQVEKFSTPVTKNERTQSRTTEQTDNVESDTSTEATKIDKPGKGNADLPDSHPLAVFRVMDNLKFTDIILKINDSANSIIISVGDTNKTVAYSDLGLARPNNITPNVQAIAFWEIVRREFDYKKRTNRRRLASLSTALRQAFGANDTPFRMGEARFTITNPSKLLARKAKSKTDQHNEDYHSTDNLTPDRVLESEMSQTEKDKWLEENDSDFGTTQSTYVSLDKD